MNCLVEKYQYVNASAIISEILYEYHLHNKEGLKLDEPEQKFSKF